MGWKLNEALEKSKDKSVANFVLDIEIINTQYTEFFNACNFEVTKFQRGQRNMLERIFNLAIKHELLVRDGDDDDLPF